MRRTLVLLLTLCALISVGRFAVSAAAAACAHAEPAGHASEHDCCRANKGRAHNHGDAATHDPAPAPAAAHCAGQGAHTYVNHASSHASLAARERDTATAFSLAAPGGERGCSDCCARSRKSLPSHVAAPTQKSAEETAARPVSSQRLVVPDAPHQRQYAPHQHAPPGAAPRHLLISVFQI